MATPPAVMGASFSARARASVPSNAPGLPVISDVSDVITSQVHHPSLRLFSLRLRNVGFHISTSLNILQHPSTSTTRTTTNSLTDSLTDSLTTSDNSHPILLDELQVLALCLDDVLLPGLGGNTSAEAPQNRKADRGHRGRRGTATMDIGPWI